VRFALNADKELDATAVGVYESLWSEAFSDLSDSCLSAAFQKTLRTAQFWPIKVADVRKHVSQAVSNATDEASEKAWGRVLEIRRVSWNPDIPGPFDRAVARLSERVRQAARAAGVFRDFTAEEYENGALHTWAKKRFLESFNAWGEREQDKFLLPDGEAKKLLIEFAETKALPWTKPKEAPQLPAEERLRVADEVAEAAREVLASYKPKEHLVTVSDETRTALRRQAEMLKRSFPMRPEAFSENPQLRKVYERFGLEIPELPQAQTEERTAKP
jgi:hypothetical protein